MSSKNPYGIIVARAIAKRKRERGLEKAEKKKSKKNVIPKNKPVIDVDVMSYRLVGCFDVEEWDSRWRAYA